MRAIANLLPYPSRANMDPPPTLVVNPGPSRTPIRNPYDEQSASRSSPAAVMDSTFTVEDVHILFNEIHIMPDAHFTAGVVDGIPTAATAPDPCSQTGSLGV